MVIGEKIPMAIKIRQIFQKSPHPKEQEQQEQEPSPKFSKGYSQKEKNSIFKDTIQIEVDLPPSHPIFDKVLIMLGYVS